VLQAVLAIREASRADLARHHGVSKARVYQYLQGQRMREQTVHKMAAFFGVDIEYLIDHKPLTLMDLAPHPLLSESKAKVDTA
jgi:transcriptional regulator with XRE-family HTH domain